MKRPVVGDTVTWLDIGPMREYTGVVESIVSETWMRVRKPGSDSTTDVAFCDVIAQPCAKVPDGREFKTIGMDPCGDCGTFECWLHYLRWEMNTDCHINADEYWRAVAFCPCGNAPGLKLVKPPPAPIDEPAKLVYLNCMCGFCFGELFMRARQGWDRWYLAHTRPLATEQWIDGPELALYIARVTATSN